MSALIRLLANAIASPRLQGLGLAKLISILTRLIFACQISPGVRIGRNISLGYGGLGIVIHGGARIGDHVAVGPHVLIGGNLGKGGVPEIGNHVRIGPGAVLIGPIKVGDDAIIAPNSVVNRDVEAGMIVAGSPARVVGTSKDRLPYG
jgi:serine O-acetyltransferase